MMLMLDLLLPHVHVERCNSPFLPFVILTFTLLKWCVFNAYVLSLLLYGSECWAPLQCDIRRLSSFHMRGIRSILGITQAQALAEHISSAELLAL